MQREMRERELLIEALVEGEEVIALKRATLVTEAERCALGSPPVPVCPASPR